MDILNQLRQDYLTFPENQTYSIYADDVYFQDPFNKFTGIERYQKMIAFLARSFQNIHLTLHEIQQESNEIRTDWTLEMTCPLPWKPILKITGYSLLKISDRGLIDSHIDYWHTPILQVIRQVFSTNQ